MDSVLQGMEVVQRRSLSCSCAESLLAYPQAEERHRYMLEKSLCSLVCATVQDDPEKSWSSYWKKSLWHHNVTRDLWPYKTM
jgi:hypothetical protein